MRYLLIFFSFFITIMLSGCQMDGPFNAGQKRALQQQGFQYLGSHWELGINDKILFGIEQSSLTPESRQRISTIANNLKRVGVFHVAINGHTDNDGEADYNQRLSYLRAKSVATVWVESTGGNLKDFTVRG